jgi:hypothetical protein
MTGATIAIDDASAVDTILSVKERVHAASANPKFPVSRQRLVYRPLCMEALPNDETLGSVGVAQDGTAQLDMLLAEVKEQDKWKFGAQVLLDMF